MTSLASTLHGPPSSPPRQRDRSALSDRTAVLFADAAAARARGDERTHADLLDEIVGLNVPVAASIAAHYRSRGIATEDLEGAANLGLVKAAHGFDPAAGPPFLAYAVPTIRGEIKRWFRDQGWAIRPPRRLQELQARINAEQPALCSTLGRSPRPEELAEHLGEGLDLVIEALSIRGCFTPASLDRRVGLDGDTVLGDLVGDPHEDQSAAEARVMLAPLLRELTARDRHIVVLRFFCGWTQQEIADDIEVTQMQVSRLLTRILGELRRELDG